MHFFALILEKIRKSLGICSKLYPHAMYNMCIYDLNIIVIIIQLKFGKNMLNAQPLPLNKSIHRLLCLVPDCFSLLFIVFYDAHFLKIAVFHFLLYGVVFVDVCL